MGYVEHYYLIIQISTLILIRITWKITIKIFKVYIMNIQLSAQGSWGRLGKGEYIHWTYKVLLNFFPGLSFWLYLLLLHPINYVSRQILWCNFKQAGLLYYIILMIQNKPVLPKDMKNAMNQLSPKPVQTKAISKEWLMAVSFQCMTKFTTNK